MKIPLPSQRLNSSNKTIQNSLFCFFVSGWDISSMNLADAMSRAQVLEYELQQKLNPYMKNLKPRPSIYFPSFIAANQKDRADNVLTGGWQVVLCLVFLSPCWKEHSIFQLIKIFTPLHSLVVIIYNTDHKYIDSYISQFQRMIIALQTSGHWAIYYIP